MGADDGLVSTASLVLGVAAAHGTHRSVLVAGVAGLVAGAMSMAAGEYVSVHSQSDTENADLKLERAELATDDRGEHEELAAIYVGAAMPLCVAGVVPDRALIVSVSGTSFLCLALLGTLAARAGGAPLGLGALRVAFWGALAMGITAGAGVLFGAVA
jgi:VIT1/CCC1 family predicted Fe2+/Mn2+ transporter